MNDRFGDADLAAATHVAWRYGLKHCGSSSAGGSGRSEWATSLGERADGTDRIVSRERRFGVGVVSIADIHGRCGLTLEVLEPDEMNVRKRQIELNRKRCQRKRTPACKLLRTQGHDQSRPPAKPNPSPTQSIGISGIIKLGVRSGGAIPMSPLVNHDIGPFPGCPLLTPIATGRDTERPPFFESGFQ